MRARVILQGQPGGESVGNVLQQSFADSDFTRFDALVAFASVAGVTFLRDQLDKAAPHLHGARIVVGVDLKGTSSEALTSILSARATVTVYHTTSAPIFHPKLYLFTGPAHARLIVGSSNLTVPGLFQNVEASTVIDFDIGEADGDALIELVHKFQDDPATVWASNQHPLSGEIIELLQKADIVPNEADRAARERKIEAEAGGIAGDVEQLAGAAEVKALFPPVKVPAGPPRPPPLMVPTSPVAASATAPPAPAPSGQSGQAPPTTAQDPTPVLVAEIPRAGNRWNQANFDLGTFRTFFQLGPAGNQQVVLIPIRRDGSDGVQEDHPSVSVRSQNYRIELGQAANRAYPTTGRPVGVFVRVGERRFRYRLSMPGDAGHLELETLLTNLWRGPAKEVRRVQLTVGDFRVRAPSVRL